MPFEKTPQVGPDFIFSRNDITVGFPIFQRPLLFCAVDLTKIIDTSVGRRCARLTNEIWCCRQSNKSNKNTSECRLNYESRNGPGAFVFYRFAHPIHSTPHHRFGYNNYPLRHAMPKRQPLWMRMSRLSTGSHFSPYAHLPNGFASPAIPFSASNRCAPRISYRPHCWRR
jgi:hypothetical protein